MKMCMCIFMRILCVNLSVYVSVYVYTDFHICIDLCKCTCIYTPAAETDGDCGLATAG